MLVVKNLPANAGDIRDTGSIPQSGRFPGGGHGNPLQYSCLENSMTEEPGGLESIASRSDKTEVTLHAKLRLAAGNRKDKAWTQYVECSYPNRRRLWHPTPVLLPGKSCGRRSLQSMGSRRVGHDWATSLSLFTFHFCTLEKEMATHSSILAWRIPGTGEPVGLPSMGSHRVRHDWSDLAAAAAYPNRTISLTTGIYPYLSLHNEGGS